MRHLHLPFLIFLFSLPPEKIRILDWEKCLVMMHFRGLLFSEAVWDSLFTRNQVHKLCEKPLNLLGRSNAL